MSSTPITAGLSFRNSEQRRSPRQRIDALMYVGLGDENGGFPINVSEGGMAFQGIRPLEKDQLVYINFKLPGLGNFVESAAQIAWLNDLGKGGGLQFIDLPEGARQSIGEWLSKQTASCGLTGNTPIPRATVEAKNFKFAPDILSVENEERSSGKAESSAVESSLDSTPSPAPATIAITTLDAPAIPIHPVDSAKDFGLQGPRLNNKRRKKWSAPLSPGQMAAAVIAAILGAISFQFHGGLWLPTGSGNPASSSSQSIVATAPQFPPVTQTADAPPRDSTNSGSADTTAVPSTIDSTHAVEEPATTRVEAPISSAAKKVVPLKIRPPRPFSRLMGLNAKVATPNLKAMSPAADVTPPALTLPTNPATAPQLPALLLETPPSAPSPRETVRQSGGFDAAKLIARKNPVYPKVAQVAGLIGSVELNFIIGTDGYVREVTVVKGNPILARAAVEALQTWRYQPARRDGVPVETESSTAFTFKPN